MSQRNGSRTHLSQIGDRLLNSSPETAQFWDGRARDLKEQAGDPIANPGEMAFTHELAVDMLASIPAYRAEFKKVFSKKPLTIDQVTDAIAAFEESLVTPNLWPSSKR